MIFNLRTFWLLGTVFGLCALSSCNSSADRGHNPVPDGAAFDGAAGNPPLTNAMLTDLRGTWTGTIGGDFSTLAVDSDGNVTGSGVKSMWSIDATGKVSGGGTISFITGQSLIIASATWTLQLDGNRTKLYGEVYGAHASLRTLNVSLTKTSSSGADGGVTPPPETVGVWKPTSELRAPQGAAFTNDSAAWLGAELFAWSAGTAARYSLSSNSWKPVSMVGAPETDDVPVIWTGKEILVWGGNKRGTSLDTGARYDPVTDTWMPITSTGVPEARKAHAAVWIGTKMVVWGGWGGAGALRTGGLYDPAEDKWSPLSLEGAPQAVESPLAVWANDECLIFGKDGARYHPTTNTWVPMSSVGAPMIAAYEHKAVWTGKELLVGQKAAYNPATDTWRAIRSLDDMRYRTDYSLVWTGKVALFWGGEDGQYDYKNTGASYDPTVDTWKLTSTAGAPTARYNHVGIWTGDRMIVWGGGTIFAITDKTRNSESFRSGGVFTP